MSMELVTGHAGKAHVTSKQAAGLNAGILGLDDYVLAVRDRLAITVASANRVTISPGELVMEGYHASLDQPEDLTIANGSQGMKRNDLIVCRYIRDSSGVESASLVVVKGTPKASQPADPSINRLSIWDGATARDMPLYRIPLDGIAIGTPVPLFNLLQPMADVWASMTPVQYDSGHGVAWRYPGRQIAFGIVSITWEPNSAGNDAPSIRLPFKAASADWVHVQLQLCNNEGWQVDGFNQIGVIPSDISPEGFRIRSWNASDMNLTYRVAWRAVGVGTWGD